MFVADLMNTYAFTRRSERWLRVILTQVLPKGLTAHGNKLSRKA
jgi:hypothetical protein